jgi:hypothetical protein
MWKKEKIWKGNPALGLESWSKRFTNPHKNNKRTKVYVFGKGKDWNYCVDDGSNGDFSYTGTFPVQTAKEMMERVDQADLFR